MIIRAAVIVAFSLLISEGPSPAISRPVWTGEAVNFLGSPSRDGRYLTFVDLNTGDLAALDLVKGTEHRLTQQDSKRRKSEFAYFSVVSPDSTQVAYAWFNEEGFYDLRVVEFDGSAPRILYRNPEAGFVRPSAWTPDGKQILTLLFRKDNISQIALLSAADGSVEILKSLNWIYPKNMDLSPDGRYVAYDARVREDSSVHDLFLLAVDASREISLVEHPANDLFPVWTPDGRGILFASDRSSTMDLWIIRVEDGTPQGPPERIKQNLGRFLPLGITAQGSYYYGVRNGKADVYVAGFDVERGRLRGDPVAVSRPLPGTNRSPDWSPDGRFLAYLSQAGAENFGQESRVIVIHSVHDPPGSRVLSPSLAFLERLRWSPDGSTLLVSGSDGRGRGGLFQIDAHSGEVVPIVRDRSVGFRGLEGVWSVDGNAIFYVHEDEGRGAEVRHRNLEAGKEDVLYRPEPAEHLYQLVLSPEEQYLAFAAQQADPSVSFVSVLPISGGDPRRLLRARNGRVNGLEWTRDGTHLLVSTPDNGLWRVSVNGGEPVQLPLSLDRQGGIRLHPEGQYIAFTAGETASEIWVLENFLPSELVAQRKGQR